MSKTFKRIIGVSVGVIVVTGLVLLIDKQVRKMINKKSVLDDDNDPFAADFDWNEDEDDEYIENNNITKPSDENVKAKYVQIPT